MFPIALLKIRTTKSVITETIMLNNETEYMYELSFSLPYSIKALLTDEAH